MTRRMVTYLGGPLDGLQADVTDWSDRDIETGVYQIVDGWADRADYAPDVDGDPLVWRYRGVVPG